MQDRHVKQTIFAAEIVVFVAFNASKQDPSRVQASSNG